MAKTIWYISKYAIAPPYGNATRQFYFSKYFAINGYNTILISSYASGIKNNEPILFDQYYKYKVFDGVHHYLLKGPKLSLGFSFKRILSWMQFEWYVFRLCKKLYMQSPPDCVIVSSLSLLTIINGIYLKFKYNVRLIFEVRDIWPLTLTSIGGFSKWNPFIVVLSFIEKLGYRYADEIVGTMSNLLEHVNTIVKNKNVHYIPHGLDFEYYTSKISSLESKKIISNINPNCLNIIYTGSIGKANFLEYLLESFVYLETRSKKLKLHIIGSGPLKSTFQEKYKNNLNILFHDFVPKNEIPKLISHFYASVIIVPDFKVYDYGISPNKLNEYLLSGIPCIQIFNNSKTIIDEANAGYNVRFSSPENIAQSLIEIFDSSKDELKNKGKNGIQYALKYLDYDHLSIQYLKILFPYNSNF